MVGKRYEGVVERDRAGIAISFGSGNSWGLAASICHAKVAWNCKEGGDGGVHGVAGNGT